MSTSICIIICTRDRAAQIPDLLDALSALHVPSDVQCCTCIVDNGSHDDTPSILAAARLPNMPLKVLSCPERGKSRALNWALQTMKADIYLFTDDDVRPPKNWIASLTEPIIAGEADCVAGGVRLAPQYYEYGLEPELCVCLGDTRHMNVIRVDSMIGGNMAVSSRVFERVPGFSESLGPGQLGACEEVLFSVQVIKAGFRIANSSNVIAEHHFDPSRLATRYLRRRAYQEGASRGYIMYHWYRQFISSPKQKLTESIAGLQSWRRSNPDESLRTSAIAPSEVDYLIEIGVLRQYMRESKGPRLYPFEASGAVRS